MSGRPIGTAQLSYWSPAIFVAILISVFSTQYFAAERTGGVILPVLHWLFPWATGRMLHLLHSGIRKAAHVTEFGIFSITVFRGIRAGRSGWKFNWAFTTLSFRAGWPAKPHENHLEVRSQRLGAARSIEQWRSRSCEP